MPRTKTATKASTKSASVNTHGKEKQKAASQDRRKLTHEPRGITKMQNPQLPEGYNTNAINFLNLIIPKEKLDYNDVPEMERRFNRYLQLCSEHDMKVSNLGAYTAIGITKYNADYWKNDCKTNPERCDFIKKVQQICACYRENMMAEGKVNPVVGIFWQKNYDGFKDQQEVVLTPNDPLGDEASEKALKQKYLEDIGAKPIDIE